MKLVCAIEYGYINLVAAAVPVILKACYISSSFLVRCTCTCRYIVSFLYSHCMRVTSVFKDTHNFGITVS